MKTVLLIEHYWQGHHPTYFKQLSRALLELGCEVWAVCPNPDDLRRFLEKYLNEESLTRLSTWHLPEMRFPTQWSENNLRSRIGRFLSTVFYWLLAAELARTTSREKGNKAPDLTFFAKVDGLLKPFLHSKAIDFIFPYQWSGLYVHPKHDLINKRWMPELLRPEISISSKYCAGLVSIDEMYVEAMNQKYRLPVFYIPDMIDETDPSLEHPIYKQIRHLAKNRTVVGLVGALSERKNIKLLHECIKRLDKEKFYFYFAGPSSPEMEAIRQQIQSEGYENVFFYLQNILDGVDFNSILNASDILFLVYKTQWSSNVLTKAAMLRKKVLASNIGLVGKRVIEHKLGYTVDIDDSQNAARLIEKLSRENTDQFGFDEYFLLNSFSQVKKAMAALLGLEHRANKIKHYEQGKEVC